MELLSALCPMLRKTTIVSRKAAHIIIQEMDKTKPIWFNWLISITIHYGCSCQETIPIGMSIALAFCRKGMGEIKKTSGLLPNCRMRNRLPVILRNLQQMPIKRQAQTVLYPMFPFAKIQLFRNMQVKFIKITAKYRHHVKNYYFCPFINESRVMCLASRVSQSRVKTSNFESLNLKSLNTN